MTEEEYNAALVRINSLLLKEENEGLTAEEDKELYDLTIAVEEYEQISEPWQDEPLQSEDWE